MGQTKGADSGYAESGVIMFYLECQCQFRNVWNEVEGVSPYADLNTAIWAARQIAFQRRTAVRIVDDAGNLVWQ
jgi:hypothetical protein